MMMCLPLTALAQNTWENTTPEGTNPDAPYLVGAVPTVDGQVTFNTVINAPGKSATDIYDKALKYVQQLTKESNQTEQTRIAMADNKEHIILARMQEWLVFKRKALVLDQTRFLYQLIVKCSEGKADITINRISYIYDEERNPLTYRAEEWITDQYGLKKNKTKLSRVSGKFRRKTIDRKNYLFKQFENILK